MGSRDPIKTSASWPLTVAEIGIGKSFVIVMASKDSQAWWWCYALADIFSLMTVEHGPWESGGPMRGSIDLFSDRKLLFLGLNGR